MARGAPSLQRSARPSALKSPPDFHWNGIGQQTVSPGQIGYPLAAVSGLALRKELQPCGETLTPKCRKVRKIQDAVIAARRQ